MINVQALVAAFEEIIGWPYVSPGSNDQSGIDCSGAFVRAYRKHGLSIYHGSNTIFRKHCSGTGRIDSDVSRLRMGMAVFKQREDGSEPEKYRGDGYGNMYHIGLVTSVSPLRIVHATPPSAAVDTKIGKWGWYGLLDKVDYGSSQESGGNMPMAVQKATVVSANGKAVNLRPTPGTEKSYIAKVSVGATVEVQERGSEWCTVTYGGLRGYMMAKFLAFENAPSSGGNSLEEWQRQIEARLEALEMDRG